MAYPSRFFAGLMNGFALVDMSLSSPLTGRRGQKRFGCTKSALIFVWLMDTFALMDRSLSSQLTLRMTSNSLSLFEVIGRRCPRTPFCLYGYIGRRSRFLFHRRPFILLCSPCLWRTLFLCLDVRALPSHSRKPSSARLDPAL